MSVLSLSTPTLKLVNTIIATPSGQFHSLGALQFMNHPVAIPADRLQVVHPVGTAVRTIFSVMRLQRPAGPAACTFPPGSLHRDSGVQNVHALDEGPESHPLHASRGCRDQFTVVECTECYSSSFVGEPADFVTR